MKMLKKLEPISAAVIAYLMLIIMAFLTVVSFFEDAYFQTDYIEMIYYRLDSVDVNLLFLFVTFLFFVVMYRKRYFDKISLQVLLGGSLIWCLLLSGVWVAVTHSLPQADQAMVLDKVNEIINEDFSSLSNGSYLMRHQHQLGLFLIFEMVFRIFSKGEVNYWIIRIVNIFLIAGVFYGLHLITEELTGKNEIIVSELLLAFGWFPLMLYAVFVYGVIPGLFCSVFAIFCMLRFLRTKQVCYGIIMTFLIALAVLLKRNYLIFAIAISLVLVIKAITEKKYKYLLIIFLMVTSIAGMSKSVTKIYELRSGVELTGGMPTSAWIAMGMQEGFRAEGWYNGYSDFLYNGTECNAQATDEIAKEYIYQRISEFKENPKEFCRFYTKKIVSQWNEATYESLWVSKNKEEPDPVELGKVVTSIYEGKLHAVVEEFMNLYQLLLYLGTALCAWKLRKSRDLKDMILLLCILGGFLFHILWEAKSQYIFPYVTLMLPCAAIGLSYATEKWCQFDAWNKICKARKNK